jgi:hypothetical protein
MEVNNHRVSTSERSLPGGKRTRSKHIRFLCKFRNGQENWAQADAVRLQDPIPAIQYIERAGLTALANFAWVTPFLKDGPRLASMVNAFKAKVAFGPKFKFGLEVPRNPRHALELDVISGNHVWKEAMGIELRQINEYQTFRVLGDGEFLPATYQKIPYHMVFDVKFDWLLVATGLTLPRKIFTLEWCPLIQFNWALLCLLCMVSPSVQRTSLVLSSMESQKNIRS